MAKTPRFRIDLAEPSDSDIARDWLSRMLSTLLSAAALIFCPTILGGVVGNLVWGFVLTGKCMGFCFGMWSAGKLVPRRMIIRVPENSGYVTQNMIRGFLTAYGPGDHPTFWTELRNEERNYTLGVIDDAVTLPIPTATSEIRLKLDYTCRRSLKHLTASVKFGPGSLRAQNTLEGFMESFLTGYCTDKKALDLSEKDKQDALNDALAAEFVAGGENYQKETDYERLTGFEINSIVLSTIEFSEGVQDGRDSADALRELIAAVAEGFGLTVPELKRRRALPKDDPLKISDESYATAYKDALAVAGFATMNIHAFSGIVPEGTRMNLSEGKGESRRGKN